MKTVTFASLRRALSRPLVLHPRSLLAGTALGVVAFFAMSQSIVSAPTAVLRVEYLPHPRDIFRIEEGTTYTVPVGKVFVLMGIGRISSYGSTSTVVLNANGIADWSAGPQAAYLCPAPHGLTYATGTGITLADSSTPPGNDTYATGYLVTK